MFQQIGAFHYGSKDKSSPVESLKASLIESGGKEKLHGSLVVLPEAFNLARDYGASEVISADSTVASALRALASDFGVVFAAGLIEPAVNGLELPYSAAYLIGSDREHRLCRKMGEDHNANKLYRPCTEQCDSPTMCNDACVAALICMDATYPLPDGASILFACRHREDLLEQMGQYSASATVLCVPAYMSHHFTSEGIAEEWPDQHFALANSHPAGCPSVVRLRGGVPLTFKNPENKLIFASIL